MAKFLNIAHPDDVPSVINVDDIVRIRPGLESSGWTGRDAACTIFLRSVVDVEYEGGGRINMVAELVTVEVHLPIKQILLRMRTQIYLV